MNRYDSILSFRGTWRKYQERVLNASEEYLDDHKIHIVAAPGAGKTTLGIELIRRTGMPCLVLSPRIVIRQQWLERIETAFLQDGLHAEDYLSNDICAPKLITSITYQTLFCGMTKYRGTETEETSSYEEEVDYSQFELIKTVKEAGIGVICLDECHHLKSEWWKALENFMKEMKGVVVIALTATPPYDSTPTQWERYCNMCGPVDEEITVPELVKEGSLCPHQDYVYFNYPSKEEQEVVENFRDKADQMYLQLMEDENLVKAVSTHKALNDCHSMTDTMLENVAYLSSMLIFAQAKGITFSREWLKILGVKKLPDMTEKWMELLLQGFLYDDIESFVCAKVYREQLIGSLKAHGLTERNKVSFLVNSKVEKTLINSKGKLESIRAIAQSEYASMHEQLRMLILTDYIRKEYMQSLGNQDKQVDTIGVLPIFELLRRERADWKLGVLCGSLILLPDTALGTLELIAKEIGYEETVATRQLCNAERNPIGYSEVRIKGKIHVYTQMITKLFEAGEIQILIGTKSLLGEGWDSPCINSLILASFVGSYVLSNQMRGRAIRTSAENPEKTSNIWHLVCLAHKKEQKEKKKLGVEHAELSEDYKVLRRRMEGFFGVSYDGTSIENGMERLNIICEPFTPSHIKKINTEMLQRSQERAKLFQQWKEAVFLFEKMEIVEECQMDKGFLKRGSYFINGIGLLILLFAGQFYNVLVRGVFQSEMSLLDAGVTLVLAGCILQVIVKLVRMCSPLKRLKNIGKGVLEALQHSGEIKSNCRVETEEEDMIYHVYLTGGTAREKNTFADCIEGMLQPIDNQRYLLHSKRGRLTMENYYCVPDQFARAKESAEIFRKSVSSNIGPYELVYTRNGAGRKTLLKARAKAFANRNERIFDRKKKVKGVLE